MGLERIKQQRTTNLSLPNFRGTYTQRKGKSITQPTHNNHMRSLHINVILSIIIIIVGRVEVEKNKHRETINNYS